MPKTRPGFVNSSDPILLKQAKAIPVDKITSKTTQKVIQTLLGYGYGQQKDRKKPVLVGLAAPQVGISKRIILVDVAADGHGKAGDLRVYVNPQIIFFSKEENEWYEGCFSTDRVCGIVSRPTKIKLKAFSGEGKEVVEEYYGYTARIFQHEIDHLDGKEFTTHITDENNLHWVEDDEFVQYRDKEAWRSWPHKCPRAKWEKIKGINN